MGSHLIPVALSHVELLYWPGFFSAKQATLHLVAQSNWSIPFAFVFGMQLYTPEQKLKATSSSYSRLFQIMQVPLLATIRTHFCIEICTHSPQPSAQTRRCGSLGFFFKMMMRSQHDEVFGLLVIYHPKKCTR